MQQKNTKGIFIIALVGVNSEQFQLRNLGSIFLFLNPLTIDWDQSCINLKKASF